MPNTYTQIHLQFIFAVKKRDALIKNEWKEILHQNISGIINHNTHKMIRINSMPDHIHILIGMRPHQSISSLVQNIKTESSKFLKRENICRNFSWQEGCGAFSYAKNELASVMIISRTRKSIIEIELLLTSIKKY